MSRTALITLSFLCAIGAPLEAEAGLVSSFESDFPVDIGDSWEGWSYTGDVSRQDAGFGVGPTAGDFQALLTTSSEFGDGSTFSGDDAVGVGGLESFLGLTAGTLGNFGAVEGSVIRRTITASAGDTLSFDYNFLTTEFNDPEDHNDFAFVAIQSLSVLSDVAEVLSLTGNASNAVLDPFFLDPTYETGYRTFHYTFLTPGAYTLGIGVVDVGDDFFPSGLLIDNVRLTPVPEPSAIALGLVGIAVCAGYGIARRRRPTTGPGPR